MELSQNLREKIAQLPDTFGVYIMKSRGQVIYVGKAISLKNRVRQYFMQSKTHSPKVRAMVSHIDDFETILCASELDALLLENNLIKKHKPVYNILLKDDKTYPYIRLDTHEPYPVLRLVRRVEKDGAQYFGPYFSATTVREALETACQAFPLRTCNRDMDRTYARPCIRYETKSCLGPCCIKGQREEYEQALAGAVAFLKGDTAAIVEKLKAQMMAQAKAMDFEKAAVTRDRISRIEKLSEKQFVANLPLDSCDVLACAYENEDCGVQVVHLRHGAVVGADFFPLERRFDELPGELLLSFAAQHYLADAGAVPGQILFAQAVGDEGAALCDALCAHSGHAVVFATPQRGKKKALCDMALKNARENVHKLAESRSRKGERTSKASESLARILGIKTPRRIECYDISHFQGAHTFASMVVFENGVASKKDYRIFSIKTVEGIDDFASMAEVITRRLTRLAKQSPGFEQAPDLILIDGGKGQLSHALEAARAVPGLETLPPFFSLAERFEEVYAPGKSAPILIPRDEPALFLLQRLRDEAHRFAITHHRTARQKSTLFSKLEEIEGVGPTRRRALLRHFGSLKAVREASLEELTNVPGIPQSCAENIWNHFHLSETPKAPQ